MELFDPLAQYVRNGSIKLNIDIEAKEIDINNNESSENLNKSNIICPICLESLLNLPVITLKCGHMFCQNCIDKAIRPRKKCAICIAKVLSSHLRRIFLTYGPWKGMFNRCCSTIQLKFKLNWFFHGIFIYI